MQQDSCTALCLWLIAGALFPMWIWDVIVSTVVPICAVMTVYCFLTAAAVVALSQPFPFQQVGCLVHDAVLSQNSHSPMFVDGLWRDSHMFVLSQSPMHGDTSSTICFGLL